MKLIDKTKEILGELIAFPSVSNTSNLDIINYLANRLDDVGAVVEIMPNEKGDKANLYATIGGRSKNAVILNGHTDVVPVEGQNWNFEPFKMQQKDGRLYGRGSCDMKGFIASVMALAPDFAKTRLRAPVHFAFTYDEEVGCLGAKRLTTMMANKNDVLPNIALVGEPTGLRVVKAHKGCCKFTTIFKGLGGHGSNPPVGVNAVEYAVRYADRLLELAEQLKENSDSTSDFEPSWATLQIGRITGGSAHNVIAAQCSVDWELRPLKPADIDYVISNTEDYCQQNLLPRMREVFADASISLQRLSEVPSFNASKDSKAKELMLRLTGANDCDVAAFATEASLFQSIGIESIICGPGDIAQAHQPDEYIEISQLQKCIDILLKLRQQLSH